MDTLISLKTRGENREDNYCGFTLREFVDFYVQCAVGLVGCNGPCPTFSDYSRQISRRLTKRFSLDETRYLHLLRFVYSYGNANGRGMGAYEHSPVTFVGIPGEAVRVKLAEGINLDNLGTIVQDTMGEIGKYIDSQLTEIFLNDSGNHSPEVKYPRIDSFDVWFARVRKNMHSPGGNCHSGNC